jgi:hypothetical protein
MECRAITAVLRIEEVMRQEIFMIWPSEPRTWGHRSGSLGQLDEMYEKKILPLGGSDLRVVWNKINKLRFRVCDYSRHIARLFATQYLTKASMGQGKLDNIKNTPRNDDTFPWSINNDGIR